MKFWKYSGAGNDFVLFEAKERAAFTPELLAQLCDRRFGVGADGVLFVSTSKQGPVDFVMNYLNADGNEVGMCGNGARACVHWFTTQYQCTETTFETATGARYHGRLLGNGRAEVSMNEFRDYNQIPLQDIFSGESAYLDTGVPHCVFILSEDQDIGDEGWMKMAPQVRNDARFAQGTNVNFVKVLGEKIVSARTYERGVEGETLACGTGAVAIARHLRQTKGWQKTALYVPGGILEARFEADDCWLAGPIIQVFSGELNLENWGRIAP